MDAEIQAMDGNQATVQVLDSGKMQPRSFMFAVAGTSVDAPSLPSLDAGFGIHAEMTGLLHLCINDENRSLATSNKEVVHHFL